MKAIVIYDLVTSIRKERKRIATMNCRRWQMYYDTMTGERFSVPCLTREQIKATTLPPTNNGQPTKTINLWYPDRGDPVTAIVPDCSLFCAIEFENIKDRQTDAVMQGKMSINETK